MMSIVLFFSKFEMKVLVIDTKHQRRTKQLVANVLTRKNKVISFCNFSDFSVIKLFHIFAIV